MPGFTQSFYNDTPAYTGSYNRVLSVLDACGYQSHFQELDWRSRSATTWLDQIERRAEEISGGESGIFLAGFSLGALIAALAASQLENNDRVPVRGLIACSPSPWLGKRWLPLACTISGSGANMLNPQLHESLLEYELPALRCPVQLYAGSLEHPILHDMRAAAATAWPQAEFITSPAGHDLYEEPYLNALRHNAGRLAL